MQWNRKIKVPKPEALLLMQKKKKNTGKENMIKIDVEIK